MKITERDIFNYVFYPEVLEEDKKKYIETSDKLQSQVDFYSSIKSSMNQEVPERIKQKINEKIKAQNAKKRIMLSPINQLDAPQEVAIKLAAKSIEPDEYLKIVNYSDTEQQFLAKIQSYDQHTKIFIIPVDTKTISDISLTIYPQKISYHLESSNEALVIDEAIDNIEFIEIAY